MTSAAVIQVPVRFETYGIVGAPNSMRRQNAPNSSRIGSSIDEWAATSIWMRALSTSRAVSVASSSSMSACGPDATHSSGALTAAMLNPAGSSARSSSSASGTLSIAPCGSVSKRRPRKATSARPSSIDTTPDRHAAAYSPALWPIIAAGVMPHDSRRRAIATSVANSAGSAIDGASSRRRGARRGRRRGRARPSRSTPPAARSAAGTVVDDGAVAPARRRTAGAPCPAYCAPPPGNMNTTDGASPRWWLASIGLAGASRSVGGLLRRRRHDRAAHARTACGRPGACTPTSARSTSGWARRWAASSSAALPSRVGGAPGHGDQLRHASRRARRLARRRLLDDHVGVGAAGAEAGDPGDAGAARPGLPRAQRRRSRRTGCSGSRPAGSAPRSGGSAGSRGAATRAPS